MDLDGLFVSPRPYQESAKSESPSWETLQTELVRAFFIWNQAECEGASLLDMKRPNLAVLSKDIDAKENPDAEDDLFGAMDGDEPSISDAMKAQCRENWEADFTVLT